MQAIGMTEAKWAELLARSADIGSAGASSDPSFALYGPLAQRRERFVLAQVGQSLDGRIATPSGDARDVSGSDGLEHLHRCRALVDAVILGVGTVITDDPSLSVRLVPGDSPVRVIVDCSGTIPEEARLLHDGGAPVIIFSAQDCSREHRTAEVIRLPRGERGLDPEAMLDALAARGLTQVLVEGGARTIARFLEADLVDRLHVAVSPIIIGSGPPGISLPPVRRLSEAHRPRVATYDIGSDIVFDCDFRASS